MAQTWSVIRGDIETQVSGGALSYRVSATNIGGPPKRNLSISGPFQEGETFFGFRYDSRLITLVFFADAASLALADAMRDDIYELWRGIEGETVTLKVVRDDGSVRLIDGEVVNVIDFPDAVGDRYGGSQRFAVQLECHNPFWRGQSLVVKNITVNGTTNITYDGQYPTEPIINIVGPITNPVLTQVVTGKKLDFTGTTIAAGDNYLIDTRYGYKTVLDGNLISRVANLTSDSNLADFTHETFFSVTSVQWFGILAAEANQWTAVAYGNGVWAAVASSGTNRVMRSTDGGITWSAVVAAEANIWQSVAYGNSVWVAVASSGTNRVMRSTNDGATWSAVAATEANTWRSVAYGNSVWVAVSGSGTNRVMRSTNGGVTWSAVAAAEANAWESVAYGNGVWVAVASSGTNRVMRSTDDGATWSAVAAAAANEWESVAYGNGVWVAVATTGTNRVMRSTDDGATWAAVAAAEANAWYSVAYGNGVWMAVAYNGTNRVMRSTNGGSTWTAVAAAEANEWYAVAYGNGVWVAVAGTGTNRVMRSANGGVTWSAMSAPEANTWQPIAYGNSVWVAIAQSDSLGDPANRVMRSTEFAQQYTLTGTGTTSVTEVTMTYNDIFLGI